MSAQELNVKEEAVAQMSSPIQQERQLKQKTSVPAFLVKTYEILENPILQPIMSWNPSGQAFIVKDQTQLCNSILPTYFKHKNYPSFLRQLNMYNFKKTRSEAGETEFSHKWFRRGGKGLLCHIRRRNQEDDDEGPNSAVKNLDEIELFRKQQKELKTEISTITETQSKLQAALSLILNQNDVLHNESMQLQKDLITIQKRNQSRFDNYSHLLSEIITRIQQDQASNDTKSSERLSRTKNDNKIQANQPQDANSMLALLAKESNDRDMMRIAPILQQQQLQQILGQMSQSTQSGQLGHMGMVGQPWMAQQGQFSSLANLGQFFQQKPNQPQLQIGYNNSPYMMNNTCKTVTPHQLDSPNPNLMLQYSPYMQGSASMPPSPGPGQTGNGNNGDPSKNEND